MSVFIKILELLHKYKVEPDKDGNIGIGWDSPAEGFTGVRMGYPGRGWTSVDEKLPPKTPMEEINSYPRATKTILMVEDFTDSLGYRWIEYVTGWYTGQFIEEDDGATYSVMDVTHWMPLCPPNQS